MSDTVRIEYVGKKPFAGDNVAKSGKIWNGPGDVQEVTVTQAKTLLKYPDQWALENPESATLLDAPKLVEVSNGNDTTTVDVNNLNGPVEKMTATELRAFANEKYGKTFKGGLSRAVLLDEVNELIKTATPL